MQFTDKTFLKIPPNNSLRTTARTYVMTCTLSIVSCYSIRRFFAHYYLLNASALFTND